MKCCSLMSKEKISVHVLCGLVILGAWVVCFLPTVFYMNPVKVPEKHGQSFTNISPVSSFQCNPPLIFSNSCGFCKPPCDWLSYTDHEQDAMAITDWVTAAFCVSCFSMVLATWVKIPEFMKFPHVIILLMAGMGAAVELLVIIPQFGKKSTFFCSSIFLDEAVASPTIFCKIQGALIQYASLVTGEMFVVYNVLLFKNLVIDRVPNFDYKLRYLVILTVCGILLPMIPVVYILRSSSQYVPLYLRYCFPGDNDDAFYTCVLPLQAFLSVGITCLLIVIFKLIKERSSSLIGSPNQARARQLRLQKIAIQFILVVISYITCVYLTYGLLCIQMNNGKAYEKTLTAYFKCLVFTQHCSKDFKKYETSYGLLVLSFLAGNVFQAGTFVLLAGKPKARHLWRTWRSSLTVKLRLQKKVPFNSTIQSSKASLENANEICDSNTT